MGRTPVASGTACRPWRQAKRSADQASAQGPPREGVLRKVGWPLVLALLLGQRAAGEIAESRSSLKLTLLLSLATGTTCPLCEKWSTHLEPREFSLDRLLQFNYACSFSHLAVSQEICVYKCTLFFTCQTNKLITKQFRALKPKWHLI